MVISSVFDSLSNFARPVGFAGTSAAVIYRVIDLGEEPIALTAFTKNLYSVSAVSVSVVVKDQVSLSSVVIPVVITVGAGKVLAS